MGDVWVGIAWACILIFIWLQGKIRIGEWSYEVVESCKLWFSASLQPDKNLCVRVCARHVTLSLHNKIFIEMQLSMIDVILITCNMILLQCTCHICCTGGANTLV